MTWTKGDVIEDAAVFAERYLAVSTAVEIIKNRAW
jgi:hypothetical protein